MTDEYADDPTVDEILDSFPGAKPFRDLIEASNLDEFADVAKNIDARVRNLPGDNPTRPAPTSRPEAGDPTTNSIWTKLFAEHGPYPFVGTAFLRDVVSGRLGIDP